MSTKKSSVDSGILFDSWVVKGFLGKRKHEMPFYKHKIGKRVAYQFKNDTWISSKYIGINKKTFYFNGVIEHTSY